MSELLPSAQAREIRDGLLDYLTTTFALADPDARLALAEFLSDREHGIFKGPYLRLRLPFRAAADGWQSILGWDIGLTPYGHQAAAFARLSSADLGPDKPRPLPTLVTTGTGSGKTEAFLYPILDHVLRARRERRDRDEGAHPVPDERPRQRPGEAACRPADHARGAGRDHRRPLHRAGRAAADEGQRGRAHHRPGYHPRRGAGHPAHELQDARPAPAPL